MRYTTKKSTSYERQKAGFMTDKRGQIIQTQSMLLSGWFLHWSAYCVAGIGYLFGLFLERHTLVNFLLLTGIYGTWLLIYHTGRRRAHPYWLLALFCLACASLFIPFPDTNLYWLPILPTMTACLMPLMPTKSRFFGLLAAGMLWLSTSLALDLLTHQWDIGSQIILLISFSSTCGCTATIRELALAHTQLQKSHAQVEELSVIRERNRIAREIHDTLGHTLTLLAVQLETATQLEARGDPRLREELLEARRVTKACLTDVRHSVEALRPDEASVGSLQEQLRRLVVASETTCRETSITLDLEEATYPLHPEQSLTLYRCAQEALTNIRKHAHATKVLLRLSTSSEQEDRVELTVLDNGQGCTSEHEHQTSGFGLQGMSERVALLDGTLQAGPEPKHGWRVEVVLPLKMRKPADVNTMRVYEAGKGA
jgi:signal transduction histidine kinase